LALGGGTLTVDGCTLTVGDDTSMIDITFAVGGGTLTSDGQYQVSSTIANMT
jgi:hypothetical protein